MGSRFQRKQLLSKWLAIAAVLCLTVSFKVGANDGGGSGKQFFRPDPRQSTRLTFDRIELEVPAGAAEQEMTVEMVEPDLTGIRKPRGFRVVSQMYRFGPSGTKFSGGKELDLKIDLEEKSNKAKFYYINRVTKRLEQVQTQEFNKDNGKLHVKLRHFSDYVLGISSGWDGAGLNPFTDYITQGIETVNTYGHYEPQIRLPIYSVKGRGMDLDFTIVSDTGHEATTGRGSECIRLGGIAPGLKLDLPSLHNGYEDISFWLYAKSEISVNIPGKGLYWANRRISPTSSGTGSLAGWNVYNYNGHSFAVKVNGTNTDDDGVYLNIYESTAYLSDGRCIRDYGKYQTVTDLNGNVIKYTYHTKRYLVYVSSGDSEDEIGPDKTLIDTIEDTMGRMFYFTYDSYGNLTQLQQKLSDESMKTILTISYSGKNVIITDAVGRVYTLRYNTYSGYEYMDQRKLRGVTYPNGVSSGYKYDDNTGDRITSQKWYRPNESSAFREVTYQVTRTDYDGNYDDCYVTVKDGTAKKDYIFSDNGSVLTEKVYSVASGQLLKTVANKYATLLSGTTSAGETYGSELLTSAMTTLYKSDGSAGEAITWKYEYDNWGNITKVTDPKGTVTVMAYANTNSNQSLSSLDSLYQNPLYSTGGAWDQMITKATLVADAVHGTTKLKQTHYQYDATTGDLKKESEVNNGGYLNTFYNYDSYGNLISKVDANENQISFEYADTTEKPYKTAYLTRVLTPDGRTTFATYEYDIDTGNKITATDPKGNIFRYEYDAANRLTKEYLDNSNSKIGITRQITYDDTNNTVALKFGNDTARWQEGLITYDPLCGKPTLLQRKLSDSLVTQKQFEYDTNGRLSWEQDGEGHKTTYTYDALDRKTVVTQPNGSATNYTYDDRTITITDANGNQKAQTYDLLDRLVSAEESPDMGTTSYSTTYTYDTFYDSIGGKPVYHLITSTNPKQAVTTNTYDNLGRLVKTEYPQDSNNPLTAEIFTYDNVGNLLTKTNGKGAKKLEYEYYAGYRLKEVTEPDGKIVNYTYDANDNPLTQTTTGVTYTYTYDARNRVTNLKAQLDGCTFNVGYDYDAFGRVTSINYPGRNTTVNYNYNELDLLKSIPGFVNDCSYDADNKLTSMTLGNGLINNYTYDNNDRPTRISNTNQGNLIDLNYCYDLVGNITQLNGWIYEYDAINRLVWSGNTKSGYATKSSYSQGMAWSYDEVGNRVGEKTYSQKQLQSSTDYTYDLADRLWKRGNDTYLNDNTGCRTVKYGTDATWTYNYDGESRLTSVAKGGTTIAASTYDGSGMRVKKVNDGKTIYYIYSGSNPLLEYNATTGKYTYFIYAGTRPIAEENDGVKAFYHRDHLGSILAITDENKKITGLFKYDAWGNLESSGEYDEEIIDGDDFSSRWVPLNDAQDENGNSINCDYMSGLGVNRGIGLLIYGGDSGISDVWWGNQNILASPDTDYVLTGYYRLSSDPNGSDAAKVQLLYYGANGNLIATHETEGKNCSSDWEQFTLCSHAPANAVTMEIRLGGNLSVYAVAYYDAIKLKISGLSESAGEYTGKKEDLGTGLKYFGARFYDPETGRFITQDPKKDGANWFIYCYDNPLNKIDPDGFKPRDCSSVLEQDKYHTIDDGRKGMDTFMTSTGVIPGPNTVLSTLYAFSRLNEKVNPYVVVFSERTAFLKEAGERLNKINDKINALLNKDTLTKKEASQFHKLQTEQERLKNEIKANKDADKKDIARINKDLEEWVGPGSTYNDDRSDEIGNSDNDDDDDKD